MNRSTTAVAAGLAAMVITALFVPRIKHTGRHRLDWPGGAIIFLGLFGLAYGLITGPETGWNSPVVLVSLSGGLAAIILFIIFESRQSQPLVRLKIFRSPLVAGANAVTLLVYFGLNGVLFFTVLNLQQVQGFSPTEAGLALLPPIVLITVLTGPSGALGQDRAKAPDGPGATGSVRRHGPAGHWRHQRQLPAPFPSRACPLIGMAVIIPPLTKCALSAQPAFSGSASGVNNGMARVAGLLAVAILGVMVITTFSNRLTETLRLSDLTGEQQRQILEQSEKLGGITIPQTFDVVARQQATGAIHDSFIYGFRRAMLTCSGLAFAGAAVSAATIRRRTETP